MADNDRPKCPICGGSTCDLHTRIVDEEEFKKHRAELKKHLLEMIDEDPDEVLLITHSKPKDGRGSTGMYFMGDTFSMAERIARTMGMDKGFRDVIMIATTLYSTDKIIR